MLKLKKLTAMMLIAATVTTSTISLNSVQAYASIKEDMKADTERSMETYGSTHASEDFNKGIKLVLKAKFFEDPNDDNNTVFLSTDGSFMNSKLERHTNYWEARMFWPSAYEYSVNVKDEPNSGGRTQIVSSVPTNSISSSEVSTTMGYSIGGSIGVEGKNASGSINGSYNYSQTISYVQPHFTTILEDNNLQQARWRVEFSSTPDGYDRASKNITYGNQMFMLSRLNNAGYDNLTKNDKLSTLISGGFSPNFLVALKAPKDKKETIVEVKMSRDMDKYSLDWSGFNWFGFNWLDRTDSVNKKFIINWVNHTIKPL